MIGHTFVAAVFFVPVIALHSRVVAACPRAHTPHSCSITGPINLHLILKKEQRFGIIIIGSIILYADIGCHSESKSKNKNANIFIRLDFGYYCSTTLNLM